MTQPFSIVGLGEALFDIFPDRQVLGGAPLNVAVHAHQLAAPVGGRGVVVSRVGQDDLGSQLRADLAARGMTTDYVQSDPDHDTGKVYVGLDPAGQPTYDIARNVAWDWLQFDPDLESLAQRCEALCFGTLAQREGQTRNTVLRFVESARRAVRMLDVNLRPGYDDSRNLRRGVEASTVLKLNEQEAPVVARMLGLTLGQEARAAGAASAGDHAEAEAIAAALLAEFRLQMVVLTRGPRGTLLLTDRARVEGAPARFEPADGADAVGAGDACGAAVLFGLLRRWPLQRVADLANLCGAFVAATPGATPPLPPQILEKARG